MAITSVGIRKVLPGIRNPTGDSTRVILRNTHVWVEALAGELWLFCRGAWIESRGFGLRVQRLASCI